MKREAIIKRINLSCCFFTSVFFSTVVVGHEGHDHAHWISPTIHGLTVVSLFTVMAIGLSLLLGRSIFLLAHRKKRGKK